MKLAPECGAAAMRWLTLLLAAASLGGCATRPEGAPQAAEPRLAAAEALIDGFYSFDPARLRIAMSDAADSMPRILFYQGWAEGGNYKVLERRPCRVDKVDELACDIKVRDDLIAALGTGYDVTDTFHLKFQGGRIVEVQTTSDDPPEFEKAFKWLSGERPEILEGPCKGFFDGGPTPQDCVRAVVSGFRDFAALPPR